MALSPFHGCKLTRLAAESYFRVVFLHSTSCKQSEELARLFGAHIVIFSSILLSLLFSLLPSAICSIYFTLPAARVSKAMSPCIILPYPLMRPFPVFHNFTILSSPMKDLTLPCLSTDFWRSRHDDEWLHCLICSPSFQWNGFSVVL